MIIKQYDLSDLKERNQLKRDVNKIIPFKEVFLWGPACLNYIFKDAIAALTFVFEHTENDDEGLVFEYVSAEIGYHQQTNHFYCRVVTTYGSYMLKTTDSLRYNHPIVSGIADESEIGLDPEFLSPIPKEEADEKWKSFKDGIKKILTEKKKDENDVDIIKRILLNKLVNQHLDQIFGNGSWTEWHLKKKRLDQYTVEYVIQVGYNDQNGVRRFEEIPI